MKVYYYLFTLDGEVEMDIISARRNKYSYAIEAGEFYGRREHCCSSKLSLDNENKVIGAESASVNGCYMFSASIKEITEDMKAFAVERMKKIREITKIQEETREIGKSFTNKLNEVNESEEKMPETQCCGQYRHHKPMAQDEFMCDNENSEGYGLSTAYDDCCEDGFEEAEENK